MSIRASLNRRHLLGAATVTAVAGFVRPAAAIAFKPRAVWFHNIHTGESLRTVYWADGRYIRDAVKDINWILRDHYSGAVRPMNAGVIDILGMLRHRLERAAPFQIVCGYRTPATNEMLYEEHRGVARHSFHIKGMAIDLRMEGRSTRQLRDAAMSLRAGGVGYYPRSEFVHVDCGPVRHWSWG